MNNLNTNNNNYPQNSNHYNEYNEQHVQNQEQQFSKNKFSVVGSKILVQSLLWFGLGFLLVAGLGSLWTYLIVRNANSNEDLMNSTSFKVMWGMLGVSLLGSIIFSLFSPINRRRQSSLGMAIFSYIFYVLMFSMLFSSMSVVLSLADSKVNRWMILTAFGITGVLTLICGLIAVGLTIKGVLTLTKIISIVFGVILIGNLISVFFIFWFTDDFSYWWYWVYDILFCIVMILFMIFTFFKIINYSRMLAYSEMPKSEIIRLGICFGTEILSNFMIIFMYIVQFLIRRKE